MIGNIRFMLERDSDWPVGALLMYFLITTASETFTPIDLLKFKL